MNKTYTISVEGIDISINPSELSTLDLFPTETDQYHILHAEKSFSATLLSADFRKKTFQIRINGNPYTVKLADKYDQQVEQMGLTVTANKAISEIKAPMPGLVLEVAVEVGQTVSKGDPLLILEAMKMENIIKSPGEAVVKAVFVKKGEAVDKGHLLIEME